MIDRPEIRRATHAALATVLAVCFASMPLSANAQTASAGAASQSSENRGVTVKVTPKTTGLANNRWEFGIVLDTHSAALNDDLAQSATLTLNDGRTLKPISWTGAPAGGHHREGVLAFEVPAPRPTTIELNIMRPGEAAPRTFRWQF